MPFTTGYSQEGRSPLLNAQTLRELSSLFFYLVTLGVVDHSIFAETSLLMSWFDSLTSPPPTLSAPCLSFGGTSSFEVCLLEAGISQRSALSSLHVPYTSSLGHFSYNNF